MSRVRGANLGIGYLGNFGPVKRGTTTLCAFCFSEGWNSRTDSVPPLWIGYLGHFHAQKYALLDDAELVGVVDTNADRAREIATALGAKPFTDYRDLLGAIDVASIVVPTEHHHRVAKDCLDAGVHILLEKPVTETLTQAEELIALADAGRLVFQVGHLERFNPAVVEVQRLLDRPLFFESHRLSVFKPRGTDVNVVLDLMIHDIDIILSLVQQDIRELRASGYPVLTDEVDIANARLEFPTAASPTSPPAG